MDFLGIIQELSNYSFEEKIMMCMSASALALRNYINHDYSNISQNLLPQKMETYIMLVVLSRDEKISTFSNQEGTQKFDEIINAVGSPSPSEIIRDDIHLSKSEIILIPGLQTQTPSQKRLYILYYRYHYFLHLKTISSICLMNFKMSSELNIVIFYYLGYS